MKNGDDTVTYHVPTERIKDTHTQKVVVIYSAGQRAVR